MKTYSLSDFSNPYLYGNSAESRAFTNAFNESATYNYANSQSIISGTSKDKQEYGEVEKDKEISITINIENMNGNQQDIDKLIRMIDDRIRTKSKRW